MRWRAVILSIVVASTAGAQGFEGTVTYQMGKQNETMTYSAKGGKIRMDMNDPHMPGGAAMLWDTGTSQAMMLMPAQKMYITMDMGKAMANVPDTLGHGKFTKIGSEVVAGIPCDDYQGTDAKGVKQGTYCIAHGMGNFMWFGGSNPVMKRMSARVSGLSDATAGGGFPLKITNAAGETDMIALKVEKKSMDASLFTPPAGYTQMQMPAGMGAPQH